MWRGLAAVAIVYAYGHPVFNGYRPAVLDRPFHGFYAHVNDVAYQGRNALVSFTTWKLPQRRV